MQLLLLRSLLPFFLHPSQKDGSIWLIPCCQLEQFKVHYWHSNPQHHNYFWRLCELLSITNAWIRWGQRVGKTPHWLSGHGWPPQCTQGCSIQYTGSPNLLLQYIVCINWYHLNFFFMRNCNVEMHTGLLVKKELHIGLIVNKELHVALIVKKEMHIRFFSCIQ